MGLVIASIAGYVLAVAVPWLPRSRGLGSICSVLPLALTAYFATLLPTVLAGETISVRIPWVPSLGIALSFHIDGLSLLFSLLISSIGTLVFLYASVYMKGHTHEARFYIYMLAFKSSMLGLVLASNLVSLFVFWELTSVTSYLLIGFNHEQERARHAALQALLVTGIGGLSLLAGLLMMGHISGSLELSDILAHPELLRDNALYVPILVLVLAGAFAKSAIFPLHFWLPNAMEAPTPVSAYLHSATMVKGGIYLLARLSPILGGTDEWFYSLAGFGALTMFAGALTALHQSDMKRILAYSTVSALGMLTMLLGVGTGVAISAALSVLLAHALYKGALFLIAGAVEHETGTRDANSLSGLMRVMPITAVSGMIAGLSMAGLPPAFGFIAKEALYKAAISSSAALALAAATVASGAVLVAVAIVVSLRPFWGKLSKATRAHEAPPLLWLGPAILAASGIILGLAPTGASKMLSAAASAVMGQETGLKFALWHGPNLEILLSAATILTGVAIYGARRQLETVLRPILWTFRLAPERIYSRTVDATLWIASIQTRILQSGSLRIYLATTIVTAVALVGFTLVRFHGIPSPRGPFTISVHEYVIAGAMLTSAMVVVRLPSLLSAVVVMGVIGYGTALIYVLFGAPDLAMTQFIVETLTVVLFMLGFYHLPRRVRYTRLSQTIGKALVALSAGTLVTLLMLLTTSAPRQSRLSEYFAEHSHEMADGRNVVNVILVDFRALDTLGEIVVLGTAGIGVIALLKLRADKKARRQ